jgi:hypothetical protein
MKSSAFGNSTNDALKEWGNRQDLQDFSGFNTVSENPEKSCKSCLFPEELFNEIFTTQRIYGEDGTVQRGHFRQRSRHPS